MLSDATLAYGEEMIAALLGVDALIRVAGGEQDDGLVVLNMAPDHLPEHFETMEEATSRFETLRQAANDLPEPDRRLYYTQLCGSTTALLQWRQGKVPFRQQIERFLHVPAEPASDEELNALRREMRILLTAMGYSGDLEEQCAAWEERNRVPADEVEELLAVLFDEAWDRTAQRIQIPAPKSDGMRATLVSGVPFHARCDYLHRTVELNGDLTHTRPGLKHLAVHECYPGHYVQFKLREVWYREGVAAADGLLSIVNSASSSVFEGIADNGLRVINWIVSEDDRFSHLMTRYRSGIGTVAAWQLHELGRTEEEVTAWLRNNALSGGEAWAESRMRFIAAPQRAALIWSYWWGEPSVEPVWSRQPAERQGDFLAYLYGRMHSPQTAGMFEEASES